MDSPTIYILHFIVTLLLTGMIWFIQLVHYPLFHAIDPRDFPQYERENFRTTYLNLPLMILEAASGVYLYWISDSPLLLANLVILVLNGLVTLVLKVPAHLRLSIDASPEAITNLIRINWLRTLAWTSRALILAFVFKTVIT